MNTALRSINPNNTRYLYHCVPLSTLLCLAFSLSYTSAQAPAASAQESATATQQSEEMRALTDEVIKLAIEKELLSTHAVEGSKIEARVDDGIVTLSGFVKHLVAEQVAIELAQRVRGVMSVVDLVEVEWKRRPDDELKKDVLAAIAADPATHDVKVTLDAKEGVCTLMGEVPSAGQKLLVERAVAGVIGVIEIKNELTHASAAKIPDDILKKEISELYQFAVLLDNSQIDVSVKDGVVVLNGTVSSLYLRSQASQLAYRAGAKTVDTRGVQISARHSDQTLRQKRYEGATDAQIRAAIERGWSYDPRLVGGEHQVVVRKGVATLSGNVGDLAAKLAAEKTARYTIGVRRIENKLEVRWPDEQPSDEVIAAQTREALRRDPYVDIENIKVDCQDAHIGLYGVVETEFEKEHAQWTTSRQIGVVHVDNSLTVRKKWERKADADIENDLKDRLSMMFLEDENQVTGKVENGVALLKGSVDSWFMWQAAVDAAIDAGAREPHIMIDVRYGEGNRTPYYGPFDYIPR